MELLQWRQLRSSLLSAVPAVGGRLAAAAVFSLHRPVAATTRGRASGHTSPVQPAQHCLQSSPSLQTRESCCKMSDYTVSEAGPEHTEEILDFINEHFVPGEPINAAIGLCEPGYR